MLLLKVFHTVPLENNSMYFKKSAVRVRLNVQLEVNQTLPIIKPKAIPLNLKRKQLKKKKKKKAKNATKLVLP